MIRFFLPLAFFMIAVSAVAQQDSVRKYLDADLQFTTKKEAVYPAMAIRENDHWLLYAVYPDTSVLLTVYYKDAGLTVKDGPFILYHPKKIIAQKCYFRNNVAEGHWQSYYPNGTIKNEGNIVHNNLEGVWNAWYENGFQKSSITYIYSDSAKDAGEPVHENSPVKKIARVMDDIHLDSKIDGPASTWYETGIKESVVNYHNDSLSGLCTYYRPNGKKSSAETYTNGKITDLQCFDDDGNYTGATCSISKPPVLIHPIFSALDYIEDELHREKHRSIANGDAQISFTVTAKGTVENPVIVSSPDAALSKLILQIISKMPAWSPAVTHNRKVAYPVTLTIPFYED